MCGGGECGGGGGGGVRDGVDSRVGGERGDGIEVYDCV